MMSISRLSAYLEKKLGEDLEKMLIEAQRKTAEKVLSDVKSNAPVNTGIYSSSIKIGDTEVKDGVITTSVYTDLSANWERHPNVRLGAWLEWGIGLSGEASNQYHHGFPYTPTMWWVEGNPPFVGFPARPHFLPALKSNKDTYLNNIRKVLKQ